ncbi:hypothetical protein PR002_g10746 [Phytophthora rubi]|uniref:Peptidase A2 domain-containing protein n=1 Tax=Phytophthora rubi TaxID=129364 RepID=A0A6A3MG07_9STRA|nr:hypothetical protein PR002_g10746 [Phytophthora rubi]
MQVECDQPPPQQQPGGFSGGIGNGRRWCSFCQNGSEGNSGREGEKNAAVVVPESVVSVERSDESTTKRGRTWVYRAADAELAEPKNGNDGEKGLVNGVCDGVKESPVERVDEPEGVAVLNEAVTCPEATEFVEENADDEKKESTDRVENVIAVNDTVAEELKESVRASVHEPEVTSGLRTVPNEDDKVELSGETVKVRADEDERGGTVEPLPLKRLFSNDELEAMEKCAPGQEMTVLAGTDFAVEKEEYDKELEDRLYPLDEVELQERVKKIAEARKELSIEELASYLGLPVDVLERTKGASNEEMTYPEYWQDWFENTLKSSTEAKRANRDFRDASTVPEPVRTNSTSVIIERFGLPPEGVEKIKKNVLPENEMNAKDAEAVVYSTIGVPANEDSVEDSAEKDREEGEEPTVETSPLVIRALGRRAVYEWLKKVRGEGDRPVDTLPHLPEDEGTPRGPSIRDKVPDLDWVQLLTMTAELAKRDSVPLPDWVTFSDWVERYHSNCAELVWKKLLEHEAAKASPKEEKGPRTKEPVDFDSSCLYVEVAEAVHGVSLYPEREEDISHYVEVVRPGRLTPERSEKRGLVEVVTVELPNGFGLRRDDTEETEEPEVVPGGRRVVCDVGGCEALSGGFIDCLPSRMLADTGATLSLVDKLVLKRLGRAKESLRPYEGLVRSSSGHKLRIRGWITLLVRLGSLEANLNLLVAEQLNCDAILGVDALVVFGAVIDVKERTMTLKSTKEVLGLGTTVVLETYLTAMAVSVRLPPRGQALVTTNVIGDVGDKATVLVGGSWGLPPTLCVARTLCTVHKGQVIVEVCNASTDKYWIRKGTVVAATSVIPESAFTPVEPPAERPASTKSVSGDLREGVTTDTVKTMSEERLDRPAEIVEAPKP